MKAIVLKNKNGYRKLRVSEVPLPEIGDHDVLIKVKYAGINYAEILSCQGLYSWAGKIPYILGIEGSGLVEKIGEKVRTHKIGDRVVIAGKTGTYAEYTSRNENHVLPVPEDFSFEEAAALPGNWLTAWLAIVSLAKCETGETALIQSAAGGVGLAACQLCLSLGMTVYGTSSSEKKKELLKQMGVTPLDYSDFEKHVTPDFVLESVGGDVHQRSLHTLAPLARMVSIGASSIKIQKYNPLSWLKAWRDFPGVKHKELKYQGYFGLHTGFLFEEHFETALNEWQAMTKHMQENNLKPFIQKDCIYPMSQVSEAFSLIDHRKNIGKVLLDPTR